MERVVVLGCTGAGKSQLATRLSRRIEIPVVHLDLLFWRTGWTRAPQDEALRDLEAAIASDRWILDGDFLNAGDARFVRADAVVFLDRSRGTCARRLLRRLLRDRGRTRADLPAGCSEEIDLQLLRWLWHYPETNRPRILELLVELRGRIEVHHLRSDTDVEQFLDSA